MGGTACKLLYLDALENGRDTKTSDEVGMRMLLVTLVVVVVVITIISSITVLCCDNDSFRLDWFGLSEYRRERTLGLRASKASG